MFWVDRSEVWLFRIPTCVTRSGVEPKATGVLRCTRPAFPDLAGVLVFVAIGSLRGSAAPLQPLDEHAFRLESAV